MPNATPRANSPASPDDEPRFRIAQLIRDPVLKTALVAAEEDLGLIPVLPKDENGAAGSDDAESIIRRACLEAQIEVARRDLVEAQFAAVIDRISGKELDDFQAARRVALGRMREALMRVAGLPAMSRSQLD